MYDLFWDWMLAFSYIVCAARTSIYLPLCEFVYLVNYHIHRVVLYLLIIYINKARSDEKSGEKDVCSFFTSRSMLFLHHSLFMYYPKELS